VANAHGAPVRLYYRKLRDISTETETKNGAATYIAVVPAAEILKVDTEDNLRSYIPGLSGRKRSFVHKAIEKTIVRFPDRFSQYNSGFLIGASKIKVDDQKKEIVIWDASVNNGAQSQGEIRRYLSACEKDKKEPNDFDIRVEISVDPDSDVRTEIAIARNTMTNIENISQAGKRGYFDDLDDAFKRIHPGLKLARSETDGEEFIDTRLLLQILWALMPSELMPAERTSTESRMRAYKNAALCLSDFEKVYRSREDDAGASARYTYFCDMAGQGWTIYQKWRTHPGWEGKYLRSDAKQVRRIDGNLIVEDGITFPILAALSNFIKKNAKGRWHFVAPRVFDEEYLIDIARRQLGSKEIGGRPMLMGRSGQAYEALMMLTEMAKKWADTAA